jgi:TPR repeat protein
MSCCCSSLGRSLVYLAPRRPIKTSAQDCETRGGEYVAYDRSDYATALKIWLRQAKEGDKVAQTYVGEIYETGLGVQPGYVPAAEWYRKAAEQGYEQAQINLGYRKLSGSPPGFWFCRKASMRLSCRLCFPPTRNSCGGKTHGEL